MSVRWKIGRRDRCSQLGCDRQRLRATPSMVCCGCGICAEAMVGRTVVQDGVGRLTLGKGCGAAVFVCGGVFPAIEFLNVGGARSWS